MNTCRCFRSADIVVHDSKQHQHRITNSISTLFEHSEKEPLGKDWGILFYLNKIISVIDKWMENVYKTYFEMMHQCTVFEKILKSVDITHFLHSNTTVTGTVCTDHSLIALALALALSLSALLSPTFSPFRFHSCARVPLSPTLSHAIHADFANIIISEMYGLTMQHRYMQASWHILYTVSWWNECSMDLVL